MPPTQHTASLPESYASLFESRINHLESRLDIMLGLTKQLLAVALRKHVPSDSGQNVESSRGSTDEIDEKAQLGIQSATLAFSPDAEDESLARLLGPQPFANNAKLPISDEAEEVWRHDPETVTANDIPVARDENDVCVTNDEQVATRSDVHQTIEKTPGDDFETATPSAETCSEIANRILDVIASFGQHTNAEEGSVVWKGKPLFLSKVVDQVRAGGPVCMILPAFPWKSINRIDKVLGALPDQGEKLALGRLNEICVEVGKLYPPGAILYIATDGLLFDDILGISDDDTWTYSVELMRMAQENRYHGIHLIRPMDIIGLSGPKPLSKEEYMSLVGPTRTQILEKYGKTEAEVRSMLESDPDTLMTYRGFIRFLESDLRHSTRAKEAKSGHAFRRMIKSVATQMMVRAESFTALLKDCCSSFVRLSIHPSTGAVKLSVPLIPQSDGFFPRTPWHSCVVVGLDGTYTTQHAKAVRDTHELISEDGRPLYFREKSPLWDWENAAVIMEPLPNSILLVRPPSSLQSQGVFLNEAEIEKLRQLRAVYGGRIELSGFTNVW